MSDIDCKKACELLSAYIDSELTVVEKRTLDTHLNECSQCRDYLQSLDYTVRLSSKLEMYEYYEMPKEVKVKLRTFLREKCLCGDRED
jgi:predicted anti-sigma-YlaC factor YlaD